MATHTPGPWFALSGGFVSQSVGPNWYSKMVCRTQNEISEDGAANARLIAAAPELLAACEAAHKSLFAIGTAQEMTDLVYSVKRQLAAAIAKARGK
jgi:hypothetical protein